MTKTITTYTIRSDRDGHSVDSAETLGDAHGVTYTNRDDADEALESLRDDAADEDDPCHGVDYSIEETRYTLELDLDSVEEYEEDSDGDEPDPLRELMAYVTAHVRRSGRGRSETWTVGCMVGVPQSEHGSARASGAMIRYGNYPTAWTIDASDMQDVPDWAHAAVLELLSAKALEIWNRVDCER